MNQQLLNSAAVSKVKNYADLRMLPVFLYFFQLKSQIQLFGPYLEDAINIPSIRWFV